LALGDRRRRYAGVGRREIERHSLSPGRLHKGKDCDERRVVPTIGAVGIDEPGQVSSRRGIIVEADADLAQLVL
jgi:hypothetical protein